MSTKSRLKHRKVRKPFSFKRAVLFFALLTFAGGVYGVYHVYSSFDMPFGEFVRKVAIRLGAEESFLKQVYTPEARYENQQLDGRIKVERPRIVLPAEAVAETELSKDKIAHREYKTFNPCHYKIMMGYAACWYLQRDEEAAEKLLQLLLYHNVKFIDGESGDYGNGWAVAWAYDLVSDYQGISSADREVIESKLTLILENYLNILDGNSVSLWHGRSTIAAMAWIVAVSLEGEDEERIYRLRSQAQSYFMDVISALELTGGWPEGINYWVNNRAFYIVLAASAYLNAVKDGALHDRVRKVIETIGEWHIYATRPDHQFEPIGDEGPRIDMKDETRRFIDLIAHTTNSSLLYSYSRYLGDVHGSESYFSGYRWGFRLFNDPNLFIPQANKSLKMYNGVLPNSRIFGYRGMNLAYLRSGWGPDDTFMSFRAGNSFVHHGHYDAGHFTLFKGAPLIVNSSVYSGFLSPNRLNYSIRTVSKNSLLILEPNEQVSPNRFFSDNVADGGQRITLPTGSAITSVSHWFENVDKGAHFEGGQVYEFDYHEGHYTYIASDLTPAYNSVNYDENGRGGKVMRVLRDLFYLQDEDRLIIHDDVTSTSPRFVKKFLLHTINKPILNQADVLLGEENNGILESKDAKALVVNGKGMAVVHRLLPENGVMRLVGGRDYRFYVETDGDDSDLDGVNFEQEGVAQPWFENARWRIEIQPGLPKEHDHFLVVLSPSLNSPRMDDVEKLQIDERQARGVVTSNAIVVFSDRRAHHIDFSGAYNKRHLYIVGVPQVSSVQLTQKNRHHEFRSNQHGVVIIELDKLPRAPFTVSW